MKARANRDQPPLEGDAQQPTEEQSIKGTEEWTRRLELMAVEKSLVFGTKLPAQLEKLKKREIRRMAASAEATH